ncbi:acyl-CoA dehydrogenase [Streptomyces sp. NEAU-Y11]|uniref:acyl-CoA dehydrogenase n=1 Tax=Streptomyces cucumeris TaxID=2962890 RepID=UPI0020C8AC62|nr:acyl-CoA dehydrogenase [Streptomyces sp. NEAU-Y11]MCP9212282.1 acyl-CoA dehydrogenase [Streptomyces sp. NEAU-Y11]
MSHYQPHLRDLEFNLFEVFGRSEAYGRGAFAELDPATARTVLAEVARMATDDLADSLVDSDRNPPRYDPGRRSVTLPDTFKKAYRTWTDAGFHRLDLPPELGGAGAPPSLYWAVSELVLGANPAIHLYSLGIGVKVLHQLGTPEQRRLAKAMADRGWGSTMVLTEPEAGSDVGAGRTRAIRQEDGSWHLEGVKRFITSGEHDLAENIVHLVLARPEGAGPGTKGLSLFIVPKYQVTDWTTGELGARNGVYATALEHKMGLKASTTCELTFGAEHPAVGHLLGEAHDGIRQMFHIIEAARMTVGTKSIATLSSGYLTALAYARQRVQGADLTRSTDKTAPRVTIVHHPDVKRSLLLQKAHAEGMRALVLFTATVQDRMVAAEAAGNTDEEAKALNDLLLPIVKGYGSEKSFEQLTQSLQTLGGSGYLQDFPVEQYLRDSKIDSLYEGTTAIQGLDFFFRKVTRDQGKALTTLFAGIREFLDTAAGGDSLAAERALLATAFDDVRAMVATMTDQLMASLEEPTSLYRVGRNTTRLLFATGDLLLGWLLLRQAAVALEKQSTATARDTAFYRGKVACAAFFAQEVLPLLTAQRAIAASAGAEFMEVPEDAM